MIKIINTLINGLFNEESGQGMVEYGLIILLIAIAAFSAVNNFGIGVKNLYVQVNNQLS